MDKPFPWSESSRKLIELLNRQPSAGKFPALNAIRHVEMAWKISDIDREMCGFRCITAIEEAMTAVFQSLKYRKYDHADRFLKTNHAHKWSLVPFVHLIVEKFRELNHVSPDLHVEVEYRERVEHIVNSVRVGVIADRLWVKVVHKATGAIGYPMPPLNGQIMNDDHLDDFVADFDSMVKKTNVEDVAAMIHKFANQRNTLLYATKSKLPTLRDDVDIIRNVIGSATQTIHVLTAYLLIQQWPERQELVQQIVDATMKLVPQLRQKPK